MTEFDDLMEEEYDDKPHEGVMDLEAVGQEGVVLSPEVEKEVVRSVLDRFGSGPPKGVEVNEFQKSIRQLRRLDNRGQTKSRKFIGSSLLMKYAHEFSAARHTFESTSLAKPRWAVEGCVLLRAQGKCTVCEEGLKNGWKVVRYEPMNVGGGYTELNCMVLCRHCEECRHKSRSWASGSGFENDFRRFRLSILDRRWRGFRGVKGLDKVLIEKWKELKTQEERFQRLRKNKLTKMFVDIRSKSGISAEDLADKIQKMKERELRGEAPIVGDQQEDKKTVPHKEVDLQDPKFSRWITTKKE